MLELVIGIQSLLILGLVVAVVSQNARLMRAAMSRTPGEFRAAERAVKTPPSPKKSVDLDEDVQMVLRSVTAGSTNPMPHGLGGD